MNMEVHSLGHKDECRLEFIMAIRLSGMVSGMDTESLVAALVSSYTLQKDNLTKAQTKLSWKQDSWKAMNTKIYGFYTGKLSAARLSKSYNLKSASISSDKYAKVTASSSAVNGTQTLEVEELAATGYLTGGKVEGVDEKGNTAKITGSSKLSSFKGMGDLTDASVTVNVDGESSTIKLSSDMTVNQFVVKLKEAGLEASFDEENQRFFVSSKTSGKDGDFSLVADNANGLSALKNMGLLSTSAADKAEYSKWASYADDAAALTAAVDEAYKKVEIKVDKRAKEYAEKYNNAKSVIDGITTNDTWISREDIDNRIADYQTEIETLFGYAQVTDDEGNVTYDTSLMTDEDKETYNKLNNNITNLKSQAKLYDDNAKIMADMEQYVTIGDDGKAQAVSETDADLTHYNNVAAKVAEENTAARDGIQAEFEAKAQYAKSVVADIDNLEASSGAVRIDGKDSKIILNGAEFTSNTNNYSINGLTIQATAKTDGEQVTITTGTDVDGIYNSIKEFLKDYNELIKAMDTAYNADSAKGYEPLTSEEKEAMTDDEIEKWETKIKDSLLRKDSTLGNASSAMKTNMASAIEINGKKYSLASFGIKTQGYFESSATERGVYHIDGDADDTVSSGNDDKLRAAIASDPELVTEFFSKLVTKVYDDLGKRMASSSVSSVYTIYNDKEMATQYSEYNTKISNKEDEIEKWEDYYYAKFTRMETALSQLNSQQSSLSGFFGS